MVLLRGTEMSLGALARKDPIALRDNLRSLAWPRPAEASYAVAASFPHYLGLRDNLRFRCQGQDVRRAPVSGIVTLDGKPLRRAQIVLSCEDVQTDGP